MWAETPMFRWNCKRARSFSVRTCRGGDTSSISTDVSFGFRAAAADAALLLQDDAESQSYTHGVERKGFEKSAGDTALLSIIAPDSRQQRTRNFILRKISRNWHAPRDRDASSESLSLRIIFVMLMCHLSQYWCCWHR